MTSERPLRDVLAMSAGFIAWAVQFTAIYGVNSVACARGFARTSVLGLDLVSLVVVAATVLAFAAAALVLVRARARQRRIAREARTERFVVGVTILVSGLALPAILWHGLPVLIVPVCS